MQRHERLEQDTKVALSKIISYELKNPSVTGIISVTDVKITKDQKYAKIYVSIFGKKNKKEVIEALSASSGFIKLNLGKMVKFRNIPSLEFIVDNSMEYGMNMDKLIDEVIKKDGNNNYFRAV